jgi:hypothetical protein
MPRQAAAQYSLHTTSSFFRKSFCALDTVNLSRGEEKSITGEVPVIHLAPDRNNHSKPLERSKLNISLEKSLW